VRRPLLPYYTGALAFVLPLLFLTSVAVPSWTGRHALLALEAAVGLPAALALTRGPVRVPTFAALAFAAWIAISAVAAPDHTTAFWGLFGWGTGALFALAVVGCWAAGVAAGPAGAAWIERGLLAAAGINAAVAVLQSLTSLSTLQLDLVDGRPAGLMGNPVFLGGLCAGAVWLAARPAQARLLPRLALVVLLVAGTELSGSRLALALAALVVVVIVATGALRAAVVVAGCVALGIAAGALIGHVGTATTVTARGEVSSGARPRVETWLSARHAIARDPLLGSGPGRFRAATSPYRTLRLVRAEGADRLFADAHNLPVEYAVTTGLPGAMLMLLWLALVVRRAGWRAPLAGFGLVVLAVHLVEPQNVVLTPLALLALGAAAPIAGPAPRVVPAAGQFLFVVAGLGTAGLLLLGSFHLQQARLDFDLGHARRARQLLPAWPEPDRQLALVWTFTAKARGQPQLLDVARRWRRTAAERDPTDPKLWNDLAGAELEAQLRGPAQDHFRRALEHDPWSTRALNGLGQVALDDGMPAQAASLFERSLRANPDQPSVARRLAGLRP
jgi:O-antigen ligase